METKRMMEELDATPMTSVSRGDVMEGAQPAPPLVLFPSEAWFQHLADLRNANRARQEQLGNVDCVVGFRVLDGPDGEPRTFEVRFEEFSAVEVSEADPNEPRAHFVLEATLATWRGMIESIAAGHGHADVAQTLAHLSRDGVPMRVVANDPAKADLFSRYGQSLQEFVHASAALETRFPR